ncbi:Uu.00g142210.m01.CDS01 [Anthostomella pinea]|uniref:Uu.00g142210.m01.CDS01 n=1 Tax=Anthostomella pinea TaxID=933095 RepID=A0AAI8VQH5_9PEZI|nr:Uu.00g142210.m01.CDS01 [Anthostomella pinea]
MSADKPCADTIRVFWPEGPTSDSSEITWKPGQVLKADNPGDYISGAPSFQRASVSHSSKSAINGGHIHARRRPTRIGA